VIIVGQRPASHENFNEFFLTFSKKDEKKTKFLYQVDSAFLSHCRCCCSHSWHL
jgi:hypothetical protein